MKKIHCPDSPERGPCEKPLKKEPIEHPDEAPVYVPVIEPVRKPVEMPQKVGMVSLAECITGALNNARLSIPNP